MGSGTLHHEETESHEKEAEGRLHGRAGAGADAAQEEVEVGKGECKDDQEEGLNSLEPGGGDLKTKDRTVGKFVSKKEHGGCSLVIGHPKDDGNDG